MKPALADAIAVFRELGWHRVDLRRSRGREVLDLPLGNPEQRATARTGLASGRWGRDGAIGAHSYGWISDVAVDERVLAVFAIRLGLPIDRVMSILHDHPVPDELLTALLIERGPDDARRFVLRATATDTRMWRDSLSHHGRTCLVLVDHFDLPVPPTTGYAADWCAATRAALGLPWREHDLDGPTLPRDGLTRRFTEHVTVACETGVAATGALGQLLPAGVRSGLIDRERAIDLAFSALDAAVRPGDRTVWVRVLVDEIAVGPDEMVTRAALLTSVLSAGRPEAVERFAPVLIERLAGDDLEATAVAALQVGTKKALRAVLMALADRPPPGGAHTDSILDALPDPDGDPALVKLTARVREAWGVEPDPPCPATTLPRRGATRWQPTPPVWRPPAFEVGPATDDALVDAAATLAVRPVGGWDLEVERFLALANAVAADSPDRARRLLAGVRPNDREGLTWVSDWRAGHTGTALLRDRFASDPLNAREVSVMARLGRTDRLLSTPSRVDLRIDPADLLERLIRVSRSGEAVAEADLLLALTRLDVAAADRADADRFAGLDVDAVLIDGRPLPRAAGLMIADHLRRPPAEPPPRALSWESRASLLSDVPDHLAPFAPRFLDPCGVDWFLVFPTWGDAAFTTMARWSGAGTGITVRQAARRGEPFGPWAAARLWAAQRRPHSDAAQDCALALIEAWRRGLLTPGVADVARLDDEGPPTKLASLARAAVDVSGDGPLAAAWRLLDDLLAASAHSPRLLAGTLDVVRAMESLMDDVEGAVELGLADRTALAVPGLRAVAAVGGSGRAVAEAKAQLSRIDGRP